MKPRTKPVPAACTQESHAAATATLELFRANMVNRTQWFDSAEGIDMEQGDCPQCHSTLCWNFNADRPYLFWDETLAVYGYEDHDEQGICQHRSTIDALDLLGDDKAPTLKQLHALGDDWGFRTIDFRDKQGRRHTLHAESYRQPACFESRGPLRHEVTAAMDALTHRCLREAGMVAV